MTKAVRDAMERLREESELRAVRDEHGKLLYEGHPLPESVERELRLQHDLGRVAGMRWRLR